MIPWDEFFNILIGTGQVVVLIAAAFAGLWLVNKVWDWI